MNYETLLFDRKESVGIITINRPKSLNALNEKVIEELDNLFDQVETDRSLRALILTGSGEKAFVAGADIAAMAEMDANQAHEFAKKGQALTRRIEIMKIPVIAAVNGFALGGGTELALSCDFIVASENAKFGQPEVLLGLMPGFGGTQRLARFVGLPRARELIYTGDQIDAQKAYSWGLANRVVALNQLLDECLKIANTISKRAPIAVAASKEALNDGYDVAIDKGLGFEADLFSELFDTDDARNGLKAFLEKKEYQFKGE
ncbi:MAG: enoyl-CoA hydratase/isomerase family protein [Oligoflexia bacterium]|nr:enoyl-CoA hydratase/isomerase family protein [Oligoflexia bacterium]